MLWVCKGCTAKYSVDAQHCPQCGSTDYREDEEDMPKITLLGGPSNAAAESPIDGLPPNPGAPVPAPEDEALPEGEVVETPGGPFQPLPDVTGDEDLANTEKVVEPDYPEWTVEQLREQLGERKLPKSGNKDELIARLVDNDAARVAAEQNPQE